MARGDEWGEILSCYKFPYIKDDLNPKADRRGVSPQKWN